jgi:hypothetical protein
MMQLTLFSCECMKDRNEKKLKKILSSQKKDLSLIKFSKKEDMSTEIVLKDTSIALSNKKQMTYYSKKDYISNFKLLIDNLYDMIGGNEINVIKSFGDKMMTYTMLENLNLISSIKRDNIDEIVKIKKRINNFSKLYKSSGDISSLKLLKDGDTLKLEDCKSKYDITLYKEQSENIIDNINELSLVFRSAKGIIDFFNSGSNKYSYVDLINVLNKYSESIYDYVNEFKIMIEEKFNSNPSKYFKIHHLLNEYVGKIEYVINSLNDYSSKLDFFDKKYINNINKIIDKCLEKDYDKTIVIKNIYSLDEETYNDINKEFILLKKISD